MILKLSTLVVPVLFGVTFVSAKQESPGRPPQKGNASTQTDFAVIEYSGSTNTPGYRLSIDANGKAEWTLFRRRNSPVCSQNKRTLTPELAQQFFDDLRRLTPLEKLASGFCAKSASFGTTLRVRYGGAESPDLSCVVRTPGVETLLTDLGKIATALQIRTDLKSLPSACGP